MTPDDKKAWAIHLLREKHAEFSRLPHKDDFDEVTRARIKAFLGPWPRAIETAGLKAPKAAPGKPRKRKKPTSSARVQKG